MVDQPTPDTGGPAETGAQETNWPGAPGGDPLGGKVSGETISPEAMLEQLAAFGITPEMLEATLTPIVGKILSAQTEKILQLVDQRITHSVDQIAGKIAEQLQGQTAAAGAPANSAGNTQGNTLLTAIINRIGAPKPGAGTDPSAGVIGFAQTMSSMWTQVLQPMLGVYQSGRTDMLSQLSTLARMGESMPWDGGETPTAGPTVPTPTPAPATAEAHQPPKRSTAGDVARKIKLTA